MLANTSIETPDWQAIHTAFREYEATHPLTDTARPIGSVPLAAMFAEVESDPLFPRLTAELDAVIPYAAAREYAFLPESTLVPVTPVPRRTNGFGGRSRTHRAAPPEAGDSTPAAGTLQHELMKLETLHAEVLGEIDDPERRFFDWKETVDPYNGDAYYTREDIHDEGVIEAKRAHERVTMETALRALRVGVFERHPRTRGFPSPRRIQQAEDEDVYHNVAHFRAPDFRATNDPLIQAMLTDFELRLGLTPSSSNTKLTDIDWLGRYAPLWK